MQKSDFNFDLPQHLIAQEPVSPRDDARLLCVARNGEGLRHDIFCNLPNLLRKGDLLVVNNSKVLPARLIGAKSDTGGVCELLLLHQTKTDEWECLARPGKRLNSGARIVFGDGTLVADILQTLPSGSKLVRFDYDSQTFYQKLDMFGRMPLPPYITKQLANNDDYQTVYAKELGSAAAPTAGLHFTDGLLQNLKKAGIGIAYLTLHVGVGTFRPVQVENVEEHEMHSEYYNLSEQTANSINNTKQAGGRIIAVGTTSCRTLEAIATNNNGMIRPSSGETDIFIYPGYNFKAVDGLITNFHLPESTLIMLVSAFCGYENTMNAYQEAIKQEYRFFSFGDAMLIL